MTELKERTLDDFHYCSWSRPASGFRIFSGQNEGSHQPNAEAVACSRQVPFPHPFLSIKRIAFHTCSDTCIFNKTIWGKKKTIWGGKDRFVEHQSWDTKSIVWKAMQTGKWIVFSHYFWKGMVTRESRINSSSH